MIVLECVRCREEWLANRTPRGQVRAALVISQGDSLCADHWDQQRGVA